VGDLIPLHPIQILRLKLTARIARWPPLHGWRQSLNFGLGNLDTFAWIGGFSSAPNTRPPAELLPDPENAKKQLKLLYISCGNKDGLIRISKVVHAYLKEKDVPHIWHVDEHVHDFQHGKSRSTISRN